MAAFEELNVADKKKEMIAMPRHSFIQMTKLHNVMGRIDYINEINQLVLHEEDKLKVFDKNSPYLATKKIGKIIQWKNK